MQEGSHTPPTHVVPPVQPETPTTQDGWHNPVICEQTVPVAQVPPLRHDCTQNPFAAQAYSGPQSESVPHCREHKLFDPQMAPPLQVLEVHAVWVHNPFTQVEPGRQSPVTVHCSMQSPPEQVKPVWQDKPLVPQSGSQTPLLQT